MFHFKRRDVFHPQQRLTSGPVVKLSALRLARPREIADIDPRIAGTKYTNRAPEIRYDLEFIPDDIPCLC